MRKQKTNFTFAMIKPDAIKKDYHIPILYDIYQSGFDVVALKMMQLTKKQAENFYRVHKENSFYNNLTNHITSGFIIAAILVKENAVKDFRKLIGNTNSEIAEEGTIRKKFASSVLENAVHGSDSDTNALIESKILFSQSEIFTQI